MEAAALEADLNKAMPRTGKYQMPRKPSLYQFASQVTTCELRLHPVGIQYVKLCNIILSRFYGFFRTRATGDKEMLNFAEIQSMTPASKSSYIISLMTEMRLGAQTKFKCTHCDPCRVNVCIQPYYKVAAL